MSGLTCPDSTPHPPPDSNHTRTPKLLLPVKIPVVTDRPRPSPSQPDADVIISTSWVRPLPSPPSPQSRGPKLRVLDNPSLCRRRCGTERKGHRVRGGREREKCVEGTFRPDPETLGGFTSLLSSQNVLEREVRGWFRLFRPELQSRRRLPTLNQCNLWREGRPPVEGQEVPPRMTGRENRDQPIFQVVLLPVNKICNILPPNPTKTPADSPVPTRNTHLWRLLFGVEMSSSFRNPTGFSITPNPVTSIHSSQCTSEPSLRSGLTYLSRPTYVTPERDVTLSH